MAEKIANIELLVEEMQQCKEYLKCIAEKIASIELRLSAVPEAVPEAAVPEAPAVRRACAHSRTKKVNGSNQWIERLLCLTCGETFDQDTPLNVERKAAAAAHAARPVLVASPSTSSTSVEQHG